MARVSIKARSHQEKYGCYLVILLWTEYFQGYFLFWSCFTVLWFCLPCLPVWPNFSACLIIISFTCCLINYLISSCMYTPSLVLFLCLVSYLLCVCVTPVIQTCILWIILLKPVSVYSPSLCDYYSSHALQVDIMFWFGPLRSTPKGPVVPPFATPCCYATSKRRKE